MQKPPDALAAAYRLQCTICSGEAIVEMNLGAGWQLGQLIPHDATEPARGRCPRCKRYKMKVISVPPPPPPRGPKGFRRLPEK